MRKTFSKVSRTIGRRLFLHLNELVAYATCHYFCSQRAISVIGPISFGASFSINRMSRAQQEEAKLVSDCRQHSDRSNMACCSPTHLLTGCVVVSLRCRRQSCSSRTSSL